MTPCIYDNIFKSKCIKCMILMHEHGIRKELMRYVLDNGVVDGDTS